jgi:hypothetical protein
MMDWMPTLRTVLLAAGVWAATTAVTFVVVAAVVATLPVTYFRDDAARPPVGGRRAWWIAGRIVRNVLGILLIATGVLLSIPGVPGQGVLTLLAGVVLVDFPGRHRAARAIARWRGVLPAMNRLRAFFGQPALAPPD